MQKVNEYIQKNIVELSKTYQYLSDNGVLPEYKPKYNHAWNILSEFINYNTVTSLLNKMIEYEAVRKIAENE